VARRLQVGYKEVSRRLQESYKVPRTLQEGNKARERAIIHTYIL
jgi:hypothetical protein